MPRRTHAPLLCCTPLYSSTPLILGYKPCSTPLLPLPTLPQVLAWFPIQRTIITKYLRSMYTITSYVQYLGFYSQLNVPWPAGLMALFKVLP